MKKKTWNLYVPVHKRAMKADRDIYEYIGIYKLNRLERKGKRVIEVSGAG